MVGNLNSGSDRNNRRDHARNNQSVGTRLGAQHNVSAEVIRGLIQRSLTPLPIDPVPEWILIKDIRIVREATGDLAIFCEVVYGSTN